jgi:hypothetical protein
LFLKYHIFFKKKNIKKKERKRRRRQPNHPTTSNEKGGWFGHLPKIENGGVQLTGHPHNLFIYNYNGGNYIW